MPGWWLAGATAAVLSWLMSMVVQLVAGDALPPDISVSQYGVGPHGWLFSLWMFLIAGSVVSLYLYRPVRAWGADLWMGTGAVGCCVMAIVRTDPGGAQRSVSAKIHEAGSILALVGLPVGIVLTTTAALAGYFVVARWLVVASALALVLLLVSAAGVDTTGAGANTSWAVWQSIALVLDMVLMVVQVVASRTIPPQLGPEPWWAAELIGRARRAAPERPSGAAWATGVGGRGGGIRPERSAT